MREAAYPADHPVALAVAALSLACQEGAEAIAVRHVEEGAIALGVAFGSDHFDDAAAMVGLPYSPSWDLYVTPATWAEIELPLPHPRVRPSIAAEVIDQLTH